MKILAVDHNAISTAGQAVYRALGRSGEIRVRVLVPSRWYDSYRVMKFGRRESDHGFSIMSSPVLFHTRTHRLLYLHLRRHIDEFEPDIVFMNSEPENFQTFHAARLLKRRKNVILVFSTWRNIDVTRHGYPYKFGPLHALVEKAVLQRADYAVAFNESARRILEQLGFPRAVVIPPAVDTTLFSKASQEQGRGSNLSFRIGYIGRFVSGKGIDVLLRAIRSLSFEFHITMVGDGPERRSLKRLADDLGLTDRIIWHGAVAQSELPFILNSMNVLVLPSRTEKHWKEQFGRVLIEAMACGVPVIGSSSGEIPQVIGGVGMVFEEGNSEALALGLSRLYEDVGLRTRLSGAGIERVHNRYSVPVVARAYESFFRSLKETSAIPRA